MLPHQNDIQDQFVALLRLLARLSLLLLAAANFGSSGFTADRGASAIASQPPNILLIMADDLGYSDLGCYGSEIETPNLDQLAANGLRFTQFYNTARCWPTRAALLTGYYPQQIGRDALPTIPGGGGNKFRRPEWARLLPDFLRTAGYRAYHSGKWHIDGMPIEQGFDRSYYIGDQGRFFHPTRHWEDDRPLPPVSPESGYYGTTAIADHAIRVLLQHAVTHSEIPFFHYLAFTAPHFPLQALPQDIAKYSARYRRDWDLVREARWQRQQILGFPGTGLSAVERQLGPPYDFPDHLAILGENEINRPLAWSDLTAGQQQFQSTKMAIHAAMIDRMDQEIGRVLQQLEQMNALDNTVVFFLSDNGASAEIMVRDDGHDPQAPPGSAGSYLCLGPGWSTVCNTPFRRHKTWVHEGGISTPLVVSWPGHVPSGEFRTDAAHVIDIVPTILELAGVQKPDAWNETTIPMAPGISLVPAFAENGAVQHDSLWWLHEGNRAIRQDNWKLVAAKDESWELYDMATDRAEQHNLAQTHPDVVATLTATWNRQTEEFTRLRSVAETSASSSTAAGKSNTQ
ncbi:MAG: arylsulfatase [Planctomycetaceae bacterium]|nr:arylsulfatase [Planctomycetaceae bacterium]